MRTSLTACRSGAAQKLPPGHVAEDGGERILDRTDYALRLRLAVELETAVHACDHKIKAGQNVVRVVEGVSKLTPFSIKMRIPSSQLT
jgi:hypothetical protein